MIVKNKQMKIIILGAPGSGKGTISNMLVEREHYKHVSTGELFRKVIDSDTPQASELKATIISGALISDDITNEIAKKELLQLTKTKQSFILDGYPRTIDQALFLDGIVNIDKVILVDINEEILIKRIVGRRICSVCKSIYNIYYMPSKKPGVCDKDSAILIQRKDDDETIALNRIKVYEQLTAPLIDFYSKKGILYHINGDQPLELIFKDAMAVINR